MFRRLLIFVLVLPALAQDLVFVGESESEATETSVEATETSAEAAADSAEATEEFVATREWQVVRPGQAIPRGLHVRIDMQVQGALASRGAG